MNPALANLYQEVILTHHREPHHFGPLPEATHRCRLANHLCGDEITVSLLMESDAVSRCHFEGHGCALCRASASLLTDAVWGLSAESVRTLSDSVIRFLRSPPDSESPVGIGDLVALGGVREYPSRRRCATLPWEALLSALMTPLG